MKTDKHKIGITEGWISIVINTVLFAFKLWVGIISGSVALIADAWHTISDSLSSIILIIGLVISGKSPDEKHPYGHGRAELMISVVLSVLLFIVSVNFFKESIERLVNNITPQYRMAAVIVLIISIVMKELLAQYALYAAKKTKFKSLKAEGWHHRSDSITSFVILIGVFFSKQLPFIDGVLGLLISLLIMHSAYDILKDVYSTFIGETLDKKTENEIVEFIHQSEPVARKIHHFHLHQYGDHSELTFHVCLPPEYTLEQSHNIATKIEKLISEKFNYSATIHMEPSDTNEC